MLNEANLPKNLVNAEYAVRGRVPTRAGQIAAEIAQGKSSRSFNEVIFCNIGNPQQLGQPPLSWVRKVVAGCVDPSLLDAKTVNENGATVPLFAEDVIERARLHLKDIKSVGCYSPSQGLPTVQAMVADYIAERDGPEFGRPNTSDIFLFDGASPAVKAVLTLLLRSPTDGLLIPFPQYPLYSASLTLSGGAPLPYVLSHDKGWAITTDALEKAYSDAKARGIEPRGIVVINPGNPTGTVMSADNVAEVAAWAAAKGIAILADEVYQANTYVKSLPFHSFRSAVLRANGSDLFSFHSASKGLGGECGFRSGYLETTNVHPDAIAQLVKLGSLNLGSNVSGQIAFASILRPPTVGQPSYELHQKETSDLFASLTRRAGVMHATLNGLPGMECTQIEGAMYAFPRVSLPPRVVAAAREQGVQPDELYCLALLEETGICVVPGSGFGTEDGSFHFRTTILPREDRVAKVAELLTAFHKDFMAKWQ